MSSRKQRGRDNVAKRKYRPIGDAVKQQMAHDASPPECNMSCGYKVASLKRDRDCGRLVPCGHEFCFSARNGACPGIYDWAMQHALQQHGKSSNAVTIFSCPLCGSFNTPTALERVGPTNVVERTEFPMELDTATAAYLKSTPRR